MTADRQRVHKGVVVQIDRGYTKEWWWPMKDLQALALCIKFVWGLRRDWKIHLTVFIQLLLHLRLINATCVKYTDQVLPHVSTPRLTWHHHIWENLPGLPASSWKWWRPGNKAVLSTMHCLSGMLSKLSYAHTHIVTCNSVNMRRLFCLPCIVWVGCWAN